MNISRPISVRLAAGCIASSIVLSLVRELVRADFKMSVLVYKIFASFIVLFLVFMIFRRANWARWIFAVFAAIWLTAIILRPQDITRLTTGRLVEFVVQLIFWLTAAIMLFVPRTNEWFRRQNDAA